MGLTAVVDRGGFQAVLDRKGRLDPVAARSIAEPSRSPYELVPCARDTPARTGVRNQPISEGHARSTRTQFVLLPPPSDLGVREPHGDHDRRDVLRVFENPAQPTRQRPIRPRNGGQVRPGDVEKIEARQVRCDGIGLWSTPLPIHSSYVREQLEAEVRMTYEVDPRVDDYINALPEWQQAICREVRDLVHSADPDVVETVKFRNRPYFVLQGNICALLGAQDHVNIFLYDGAIVPDPDGIITGGHDNTTARTVAVRQGEPINAPALVTMFQQIIANNRAGGWRRIKRKH
jgi:hypothetical protein